MKSKCLGYGDDVFCEGDREMDTQEGDESLIISILYLIYMQYLLCLQENVCIRTAKHNKVFEFERYVPSYMFYCNS